MGVHIRDSNESDLPAVQQIYAFYVLNSLATFEEVPPTSDDLMARREKILDSGLPYLIATASDQVVGYAYASSYRARPAYRYTVEDSVYVRPDSHSRGIGTALVSTLIKRCEAAGRRQMIAVIGDSGNIASIRLHRNVGFEHVGTLKAVGYKFGRWVDTLIMQKGLGQGDAHIGDNKMP
jgi:phosphinothricin acetyltransferase